MAKAAKNKKNTATVRAALAKSGDEMSIAQKISWYSLLVMVFVVPIALSNWTWVGFKMPLSYDQFDIIKVFFQRFFTLIALGGWGWHMLTRGGKIRRTPVDWLILAFLAWVTISTMFSISPATAFFGKYRRFEGLLSFINYAVIYFLVVQFADRPSRIRALAVSLFSSSIVVAGYGFLQSVGLDFIRWGDLPFEKLRPFSTYGNPDMLGGFLMFSVPVALALALAEENKWMRLVYWAGFGLNAYVWIVAFTRGAWIGGAVGLVLLGIVAWRQSTKLTAVDWVPAGLISLAGLGAIIKSLSSTSDVFNFATRVSSIFKFNEGSGLTRTEIWKAALAAIMSSPLRFFVGWGADTFRLVFPKFKPIEYTQDAGYISVADNVHDYPLQLATGIGVVGVALMYAIFVWAAVRSFPLIFNKSDDRNRLILAGFWTAAAAYLVQLMFGLSVTGNTFLLWICIGVLLAPTATSLEIRPPNWGIVAAALLVVLAGSGVYYQFVLMAADYQYLLANSLTNGPEAIAAANKAVQLNPFNDMYRAQIGILHRNELTAVATAFFQAQQAGQPTAQYRPVLEDKLKLSVAAFEDVIAHTPDEYDNYVFIAGVYNTAGSILDPKYYDNAILWAKKGMALEPFGPAIVGEYARALIAKGQNAEGVAQLERAWEMDPNYLEYGEMLADQYSRMGRVAEAISLLKKVQLAHPEDPYVGPMLEQLEASSAATGSVEATP
jgi:putative inorganic carbon (HCO3(-)) transporter